MDVREGLERARNSLLMAPRRGQRRVPASLLHPGQRSWPNKRAGARKGRRLEYPESRTGILPGRPHGHGPALQRLGRPQGAHHPPDVRPTPRQGIAGRRHAFVAGVREVTAQRAPVRQSVVSIDGGNISEGRLRPALRTAQTACGAKVCGVSVPKLRGEWKPFVDPPCGFSAPFVFRESHNPRVRRGRDVSR